MQYINEVQNKINVIEDFFDVVLDYSIDKGVDKYVAETKKNSFEISERRYEVYKGSFVQRYITKPFIYTFFPKITNVPFILPDGSCIAYLSNKHENFPILGHLKREYDRKPRIDSRDINGIFMITPGTPDKICEIFTSSHEPYVLEEINLNDFPLTYETVYTKMHTIVAVEHLRYLLKNNKQIRQVDDRIEYTNNSYYIGNHENGTRHEYGTLVQHNGNFVFAGEWKFDSLPLKGYISFYVNDVRTMTYIEISEFERDYLTCILFDNFGGFTIPNFTDNGKYNLTVMVNYDLLAIGHYLVDFTDFKISNFKNNAFLNTDQMFYKNAFKYIKFVYGNNVIVIDRHFAAYLEKDENNNITFTFTFMNLNDIVTLVLKVHDNDVTYRLYDVGYNMSIRNTFSRYNDECFKYDTLMINDTCKLTLEGNKLLLNFYDDLICGNRLSHQFIITKNNSDMLFSRSAYYITNFYLFYNYTLNESFNEVPT